MNIYKHLVFNPNLGLDVISNMLKNWDNSRWSLHRILPVTEYEWVAVFEALDSEADEQIALGKNRVQDKASLTPVSPPK